MFVIVKRVDAGCIEYSVYYGWIISIILTRWSLGGLKERKRLQSAEHHNGASVKLPGKICGDQRTKRLNV
jgi:hypothetical protein